MEAYIQHPRWQPTALREKAEAWYRDLKRRFSPMTVYGFKDAAITVLSPHKTKMGRLRTGFHFLGVAFEVSRNPQGKNPEKTTASVAIHPRCCRRAWDKAIALKANAVHPALIQRYLVRWASWWHSVIETDFFTVMRRWLVYATRQGDHFAAINRSLLIKRNRWQVPERRVSLGSIINTGELC